MPTVEQQIVAALAPGDGSPETEAFVATLKKQTPRLKDSVFAFTSPPGVGKSKLGTALFDREGLFASSSGATGTSVIHNVCSSGSAQVPCTTVQFLDEDQFKERVKKALQRYHDGFKEDLHKLIFDVKDVIAVSVLPDAEKLPFIRNVSQQQWEFIKEKAWTVEVTRNDLAKYTVDKAGCLNVWPCVDEVTTRCLASKSALPQGIMLRDKPGKPDADRLYMREDNADRAIVNCPHIIYLMSGVRATAKHPGATPAKLHVLCVSSTEALQLSKPSHDTQEEKQQKLHKTGIPQLRAKLQAIRNEDEKEYNGQALDILVRFIKDAIHEIVPKVQSETKTFNENPKMETHKLLSTKREQFLQAMEQSGNLSTGMDTPGCRKELLTLMEDAANVSGDDLNEALDSLAKRAIQVMYSSTALAVLRNKGCHFEKPAGKAAGKAHDWNKELVDSMLKRFKNEWVSFFQKDLQHTAEELLNNLLDGYIEAVKDLLKMVDGQGVPVFPITEESKFFVNNSVRSEVANWKKKSKTMVKDCLYSKPQTFLQQGAAACLQQLLAPAYAAAAQTTGGVAGKMAAFKEQVQAHAHELFAGVQHAMKQELGSFVNEVRTALRNFAEDACTAVAGHLDLRIRTHNVERLRQVVARLMKPAETAINRCKNEDLEVPQNVLECRKLQRSIERFFKGLEDNPGEQQASPLREGASSSGPVTRKMSKLGAMEGPAVQTPHHKKPRRSDVFVPTPAGAEAPDGAHQGQAMDVDGGAEVMVDDSAGVAEDSSAAAAMDAEGSAEATAGHAAAGAVDAHQEDMSDTPPHSPAEPEGRAISAEAAAAEVLLLLHAIEDRAAQGGHASTSR